MRKRLNTLAGLSSRRLEEFLKEATNLHAFSAAAVARFVKRFEDFDLHNERVLLLQGASRRHTDYLDDRDDIGEAYVVSYVSALFRAVWIEPSARTRAWALMRFRLALVGRSEGARGQYMPLDDERRISTEAGMAFVENDLKGVSADDGTFWLRYRWVGGETPGRIRLPQPAEELPIEKALEYLLKHHNRARHCPNPDCPAPYFLAARQSRRYCSEICAQSGERETKRRWWAEHGPAWRKKRKPAASKSRRGKRDKTAEQSKGLKLKVTRSRKKGK